jgi:hypothetical protein
MKYYKDVNNEVYAYEEDGSQDHLIGDKVAMTEDEIKAHLNPPITLEQAKASKLAEVLKDYDSANQAPISYMDTTFQADYKSQDMISKALSAGSVPSDFYWLDANNNKVPMTYAQLQGLAVLLLERNQVNFDNLQTKKAAINTAKTVKQVQSI